jgi:hypothetical protein
MRKKKNNMLYEAIVEEYLLLLARRLSAGLDNVNELEGVILPLLPRTCKSEETWKLNNERRGL